ncbi:unnamed protein product [Mytilus coruscus]|uniref:VWFD domain-containing protein n=1 Tax=Mytilus coruscus TaxID=42192 RepID=A0A6J8D3Q7_MYTCO|nr:unnamed protein product [Mytilus coruscus]
MSDKKVTMELSDLQLETIKNLFGHNDWEIKILDDSAVTNEKGGNAQNPQMTTEQSTQTDNNEEDEDDDQPGFVTRETLYQNVSCSVRIRYNITNAVPGPFYRSTDFNAGLFPEKYEYTVVEGESINITLTSTVPVGCIVSNPTFRKLQCHQNIYIFQPDIEENTDQCANGVTNRDILFKAQFCGVKLGSIDWQNDKFLQVYGFSDGLYNFQDRSTYIRLSVSSISMMNDLWMDLQVPDIKINVLDKDAVLTGRLCQSYNDPHMTTFDGKLYHYMEIGEFVLYRNDRGPYWVHVLFTNCGYGWTHSSCNCGIAVRSRGSLFVLRTCEKISRDDKYLLQQPHTEIRSCDDSDLSIEHSNNNYKITIPSGTVIEFSISSWSMFISRISIKPSIYDINNAKGLCGVPSVTKDTSDDFTHREFGPVSDEKSFADSWRINTTSMIDESLFIQEPEFLHKSADNTGNTSYNTSGSTERYCVCEKKASPSADLSLFYSVQCNLTESTETCSSAQQNSVDDNAISSFVTTCVPSYYRVKRSAEHRLVRRSLSDTDDISDVKPLEFEDDLGIDVETPVFRNGWTEEEANQTCYERIENGIPTDLFGEVTGLSISDYIESCILDIKLTADTSFVQDTVGAMQTYTIMEVLRNETMAKTKTENGSQTMLEYVTSLLCPNNCSNNGNCTSGSCTCIDGYIGEDCSKDMTVPPANTTLPTNGLCSTRNRACERTNIYGFFPSKNVWCNKTHFQINGDSITYADTVTVKAEYRNSFMVSVDLKGNRRKRSTMNPVMAEGYELRLSNNGIEFGDAVNIIIYDEDCFDCNASFISCVVIESCPDFITTNIHTKTDKASTSLKTTHVTMETLKATNSQETTTQETTTSEQLTTSDFLTSTKHFTSTIDETTVDPITTTNQFTTTFKPDQGSTPYDTTFSHKATFETSPYEKTTIASTSTSSYSALSDALSSTKQLTTSVKTTSNEPTSNPKQLTTLSKTSTNKDRSSTDTIIINTISDETTTYKESTTTDVSTTNDKSTTADESTTTDEITTYKESTTTDESKTTDKSTTTDESTTKGETTKAETTKRDETTPKKESTRTAETTTIDKTTTYKESISTYETTTADESTTIYETTYKKLTTTYESTTAQNMIDVDITTLVTSTPKSTSSQLETTDETTLIETTEALLPGIMLKYISA